MDGTNNVFISWSGERSKYAAEALREWLPIVLQAAKPWISSSDIDKGSRGLDEIGRALEGMKIGIICLTPENLTAEWILYEAGALSKTLDTKTRVCTYLLGGLQPQDVKPPLGMFQSTRGDKNDTRKLIHTINKALDAPLIPDTNLDTLFDAMWPTLDQKLSALPKPEKVGEVTTRPLEEMVAEILELTRAAPGIQSAVSNLQSEIRQVGDHVGHLIRTVAPLGVTFNEPSIFAPRGSGFAALGSPVISGAQGWLTPV